MANLDIYGGYEVGKTTGNLSIRQSSVKAVDGKIGEATHSFVLSDTKGIRIQFDFWMIFDAKSGKYGLDEIHMNRGEIRVKGRAISDPYWLYDDGGGKGVAGYTDGVLWQYDETNDVSYTSMGEGNPALLKFALFALNIFDQGGDGLANQIAFNSLTSPMTSYQENGLHTYINDWTGDISVIAPPYTNGSGLYYWTDGTKNGTNIATAYWNSTDIAGVYVLELNGNISSISWNDGKGDYDINGFKYNSESNTSSVYADEKLEPGLLWAMQRFAEWMDGKSSFTLKIVKGKSEGTVDDVSSEVANLIAIFSDTLNTDKLIDQESRLVEKANYWETKYNTKVANVEDMISESSIKQWEIMDYYYRAAATCYAAATNNTNKLATSYRDQAFAISQLNLSPEDQERLATFNMLVEKVSKAFKDAKGDAYETMLNLETFGKSLSETSPAGTTPIVLKIGTSTDEATGLVKIISNPTQDPSVEGSTGYPTLSGK